MREAAKKNNVEIDDDDGEGRAPEPTSQPPVAPVPQTHKKEVNILDLDDPIPAKPQQKKDEFDIFEETFGQAPTFKDTKPQNQQVVDILEFDSDVPAQNVKQEHKRPGIFDITPSSGNKIPQQPAAPALEFEYNEMDPSQFQECWEEFESL